MNRNETHTQTIRNKQTNKNKIGARLAKFSPWPIEIKHLN